METAAAPAYIYAYRYTAKPESEYTLYVARTVKKEHPACSSSDGTDADGAGTRGAAANCGGAGDGIYIVYIYTHIYNIYIYIYI